MTEKASKNIEGKAEKTRVEIPITDTTITGPKQPRIASSLISLCSLQVVVAHNWTALSFPVLETNLASHMHQ